jgi:hypothetical protein
MALAGHHDEQQICPGPLVWFDVDCGPGCCELADPDMMHGLMECGSCGYLIVTGNFNDQEHAYTPVLRVNS